MGNNVLCDLLDYGNEYIEFFSTKEQFARNYLSVIDVFIKEHIIIRQAFDISKDWKILNSLKNSRRDDSTLVKSTTELVNDGKIEIDK